MRAVPSVLRRCLIALVGLVSALSSVVLIGGLTHVPAASAAASAPAATQCDPPAFPTGAGFQVTCTVAVANTVISTGAASSTVTGTACLAAAGVLPPFGCTTTVTTSNQLVTSVDQCNGIASGGGSNVTCNVSVVNTIPTGTATVGVTVNQCIGSGGDGGTQPTVVCTPVAGTTGATVTQCNGSGNGGGASARLQCDVTGDSSAEPVTINQCNGSSNGGGSTVSCMTTFTNDFVAAAPTTTTTLPTTPTTLPVTPTTTLPVNPTAAPPPAGTGGATGTGTTTPTGSGGASAGTGAGSPTAAGSGAGGVGGAAGSGVTGRTGSSGGAGGSTGTSTVVGTLGVVPSGSPQTGLGGAAHSRDDPLLISSAVAFAGAMLAMAFAMRRRRALCVKGSRQTS